jgi:galactokinase
MADAASQEATFINQDEIVTTAPARVNLIGEHTDYTGGIVLPLAIPFFTKVRLRLADRHQWTFTSSAFTDVLAISGELEIQARGHWSDYVLGVLRELLTLGFPVPFFQLRAESTIPFGSGLSSSAALEVAACLAMLQACSKDLSAQDVALLCQRAENFFVGSPCGIMDQFVIAAAIARHALMIRTRDLTYEAVPMDLGPMQDTSIVICNSQVKHSIATGEYRTRRKEMEAGEDVLRKRFPQVSDLGSATLRQLEECQELMPQKSFKRCRHVISENARVLSAHGSLLAGSVESLGHLLTDAHRSQRDDLQTSCPEIDFLVDTAISLRGCYGARMTGGGFGGCTVNLVDRSSAQAFSNALKLAYKAKTGLTAEVYICEPVDGALARLEHDCCEEAH